MNMKSMLVTGAAGFIASQFVNYMAKKYPEIKFIILDRLDYCASLENIDKNPNVNIIIGDMANKELVTYILNKFEIDTIVSAGASTHVDNSFYNSIEFTHNNILGLHIFLETIRIYHDKTGKINKIVVVSTDETYGSDSSSIAKTETSLLTGFNPYSASKIGSEAIAISYFWSYKLPIIISRGSNCYGPCQYPEKLIPKFICHLLNNEKVTIHGEGKSIRSFIHVLDTVKAFETLLMHAKIGEIYNISSHIDNEYSVIEVAKFLIKLFHPEVDTNDPAQLGHHIEYIEDRKFNDVRYLISSEKLEKLGWKPVKTDFIENLKELIEWYRVNKSRYGF
jgi:dTDP-glucose 4,6-dehydratase